MKDVVLIRHAEANPHSPAGKDESRTLTDRGVADVKKMATILKLKNIFPDRLYCSPARRTLQTMEIFMDVMDIPSTQKAIKDHLYDAGIADFYEVIENTPDEIDRIFVFAHNPGITGFANDLDAHSPVQMEPCALFGVRADSQSWKNFRLSDKVFCFFEHP